MKFRFDPNLEYQNQAIQAVLRLFEGAPFQQADLNVLSGNGVVGNALSLDDESLLKNLQTVQSDPDLHNGSGVPVSESLDSLDFSIEMETGTGKTYVYLRTALEL